MHKDFKWASRQRWTEQGSEEHQESHTVHVLIATEWRPWPLAGMGGKKASSYALPTQHVRRGTLGLKEDGCL